MSRTISGIYHVGIPLTLGSDNPLVISTTGTVATGTDYAISGAGPTAWTLTNFGALSTVGTQSTGVLLHAGGTVSNAATAASIYGVLYGVDIEGASGRVVNIGTISGSGAYLNGAGVQLLAGGTVTNGATNATSALISGGQSGAVYSNGGLSDLVINYGSIFGIGDAGVGIQLRSGGTVLNGAPNDTVAVISSPHDGIAVANGAGTVVNNGTVNGLASSGYKSYGVFLGHGGSVTNGAVGNTAASIGGVNYGVVISGGFGSVVNRGTISGPTYALRLNAAGSVENAGLITASSIGAVRLVDGGTVTNDASGIIIGSANGVSSTGPVTVTNLGQITASIGVIMSGGNSTVVNAGTINGTGGTAVDFTFNAGFLSRLIVDPGADFIGDVKGSSGSNTLELATAASSGTLTGIGSQFTGFGVISIDAGATWFVSGSTAGLAAGQTINGFDAADTIELTGVHESVSSYSAGVLHLIGDQTLSLNIPGPYNTASFVATLNGTSTDITVVCFAAGTRISREYDETAVEALQIGNRVHTRFHGLLPIKWIGHRRVDCSRHPEPRKVWPVRIAAGAFGSGRPQRDLWLSPDHAIFVDDMLIPVKYLINGTTVGQVAVDEVTYYHIELAHHDVLLADGLPAESYLDTGDRNKFANGGTAISLFPDFSVHQGEVVLGWEAKACAPLIVTGRRLDEIRLRLSPRAPVSTTAA